VKKVARRHQNLTREGLQEKRSSNPRKRKKEHEKEKKGKTGRDERPKMAKVGENGKQVTKGRHNLQKWARLKFDGGDSEEKRKTPRW